MVKRERLSDIIYGQLLESIVAGRLSEGSRLPTELDLAAKYEVSRQTIREALMLLQADGVVTSRQGSGTFVQKRPPHHLMELADPSGIAAILRGFEARMPIEAQMAQLAAKRRTQAELDRMATILGTMQAPDGLLEPDFAFHRAVAEAGHNEYLLKITASLEDIIRTGMTLSHQVSHVTAQERSRRVREEHDLIFNAIAAGDPEGASFAMRFHLDQARRRLVDRRALR